MNLAAIKALEQRTAELRVKSAEVNRLREDLAATQRRLAQLEAMVRELAAKR